MTKPKRSSRPNRSSRSGRSSRPSKRYGNSDLGFMGHLVSMEGVIGRAWHQVKVKGESETSSKYISTKSAWDTLREVMHLNDEAIDRKLGSDQARGAFLLDRLKFLKMRKSRDLSLPRREGALEVIDEVTKAVKKHLL